MKTMVQQFLSTPVGRLRLIANDHALVGIYFPEHRPAPSLEAVEVRSHEILDHAARELTEYFRGELTRFSTPLEPIGTDFQKAVWLALRSVPFAETRSYGAIAQMLAKPKAVRAVGAANARNPLSIIVPCHRVIGASGAATGYAGGLKAKEWLLAHERRSTHPLAATSN
jgi:methylated-DNA-[protein]-cysteine S-methyltransferase